MDMSILTVTDIAMVVYVAPDANANLTRVEGMVLRRFGPRRYHGIVLQTEGSNRYVVEGKYTLNVRAGDVLYLPQGRPYIVEAGKPGCCYCVNFYIAGGESPEPFAFAARNRARWLEMFRDMIDGWTYRGPGWRARCHARLYDMLCAMEEDRQASILPARQVQAIRGALAGFASDLRAEEHSVSELSAACGMSETYFRRLFRALYGASPKAYMMGIRFQRAKALLESTDEPIAYVARDVGFENLYQFSRAFRAREGVSPSEYRRQRR